MAEVATAVASCHGELNLSCETGGEELRWAAARTAPSSMMTPAAIVRIAGHLVAVVAVGRSLLGASCLLTVLSDSTYLQLTTERGWSHDQCIDWMCEVLPLLLLA